MTDDDERKGYDRSLLAHKVKWEGGVLATLDWGLRPEEIRDPELRAAWADLSDLHRRMRPLIRDLERRLRAA